MKYELVVEEVMEGSCVDIPENAMLANLSEPNSLGICELTYLAPETDACSEPEW